MLEGKPPTNGNMKIQMLNTSSTIIEQKILQWFCKRTILYEVKKSLNISQAIWVDRNLDFTFFIKVTKISYGKKATEHLKLQ